MKFSKCWRHVFGYKQTECYRRIMSLNIQRYYSEVLKINAQWSNFWGWERWWKKKQASSPKYSIISAIVQKSI